MVRRLVALGVLALVLVSSVAAGRTYLWCTMMQERVESCCCAPEHADTDLRESDGPAAQNGCCENHATSGLDVGSVPSNLIELPASLPAPAMGPPPVLAIAPRTAPSFVSPPSSLNPRARPIRAGPRSASDVAVRLQVFRC